MKKVKELVLLEYIYETEEEKKLHVDWMKAQGWDENGEFNERHGDETCITAKFSKYMPV